MLDQIKVDQPKWKELTTESDIFAFASEVGYPVCFFVLKKVIDNICQLMKF